MFENREEAARQIADRLQGRQFKMPLVLAIPRGGAVLGAALANALGADFDIILARKLRAPWNPQSVIGAVCEDRQYVLIDDAENMPGLSDDFLRDESKHQSNEIQKLKRLYRHGRAQARIRQRSIIVTDDGIATGASMIAALQAIRHKEPIEIIVAVPLAGVEQIDKVSRWCDEVVCIERLPYVEAVKDYYHDFPAVPDSCVVELLSRSRTEIVPDFQIRSHCPVAPPIGVMSEKDWL